jgi:hypothetical protein
MEDKKLKDLASKGRHGDTMLAHINSKEAELLKALGGAGTINPNTGLPEFWSFDVGPVSVSDEGVSVDLGGGNKVSTSDVLGIPKKITGSAADLIKTVAKPVFNAAGDLVDEAGKIVKTAAQNIAEFAATPAGQVAIAVALPGMGEVIAEQMALEDVMSKTAAKAVGTALASVSVQTAQGADFDTALKNAAVTASVATGSPDVAKYIVNAGSTPGMADALTSAGSSAGATLLKGGSANEAFKNAVAGAGASVISADTGSRVAGQVGGTLLAGGTATQAAVSAAGELGKETGGFKGKFESTSSAGPTAAAPIAESGGTVSDVPEVTVTGKRDTQGDIQNISNIPEVKVTAKRPSKEGDIQNIDIVGQKDTTQPLAKEEASPETKPYKPDLFLYSGYTPTKSGGSLGSALGTSLQAPFYPTAGTTSGLTGERGAGEIEGTETGGKRKNVWNEESLRLKDALGL